MTRFRDNVICKVTGCCESRVDFKDIKSASGYKFTKQGRVDGDYAEETVILSIVQADKLSVRFMLALEDNVWKVYDMECMGLYLSDAYKQAFEEERSNVDNFSNVLFQEVDKSRQRLVQE